MNVQATISRWGEYAAFGVTAVAIAMTAAFALIPPI